VGEQAEGMKYYSQFLLQNKVQKEIEQHVAEMFQKTVDHHQQSAQSFIERYIQFSDYYGNI
jgi:hypothetical protein